MAETKRTPRRAFRSRFTIRSMMVLVLVAAILSTVGVLMPRALDPLLSWDRGLMIGAWTRLALYAALTVLVALPFLVAAALGLGPGPEGQSRRGRLVRKLMAAIALAIGLAMLRHPLDGMRMATGLRDGSNVCFYHQYRLWPGEHVAPCLETISPTGRSRSYPIAHNVRYVGLPELRTSADQSIVWFVDPPWSRNPNRHGVWCMLDRRTGAFVGAGGPFPEGVSETGGFPPWQAGPVP